MFKKYKIIVVFVLILLAIVIFIYFKTDKKTSLKSENNSINAQKIQEIPNTLDEIEKYQKKYFEIIKRNNALLNLSSEDIVKKDLKELRDLFEEVKSKTDKTSAYYSKYEENIKNYKKKNSLNTTNEMNEFAQKSYKDVDLLLNNVYKEVKLQISNEEFEKLKNSQKNWLKEIEKYNSIFEAQDFGSIKYLIKADYEINMRSFRTLLLMLYLKSNVNDFIGNWTEISAGRIYLDIEQQNNKIIVKYGGANSAYSHSESVFECDYDENNNELICKGAKHTDTSVSCKGVHADENMDEFLKCQDKYPNEEKDDIKTYSDDDTRILCLEKGSQGKFVVDKEEYFSEELKNDAKKNYYNMRLYFKGENDPVYFYKYK